MKIFLLKQKLKISFNSFRSNFRVNQFFFQFFFLLSKLKNLERLAFVVAVVVGWLTTTTTTRKKMKKKFLWMNVAETKKKIPRSYLASVHYIWLLTTFNYWPYWPLVNFHFTTKSLWWNFRKYCDHFGKKKIFPSFSLHLRYSFDWFQSFNFFQTLLKCCLKSLPKKFSTTTEKKSLEQK